MHTSLAEINSGIYKIENIFNKKCYIGSAVSLRIRWNKHKNDLRKNIHINKHLQSAWNKYGKEGFNFDVLEEVLEKSKLVEREQHYIDKINPSYNMCPTAGSSLGYHPVRTKEANEKRSLALMNRKFSDEHKRKISESHKGKIFTKEHRQNLSDAKRDKCLGSNNHFYGKKHTEETREKMKLAWIKRAGRN